MPNDSRYRSPRIKALYGMGVLMTALPVAFAQVPSHGELAAAIRAADLPCAHVIEMVTTGDNVWRVRCNSGSYLVQKAETGEYAVSPPD